MVDKKNQFYLLFSILVVYHNKIVNNNDLEVVHPQSVLRLPDSWSNWNLEMLVFEISDS